MKKYLDNTHLRKLLFKLTPKSIQIRYITSIKYDLATAIAYIRKSLFSSCGYDFILILSCSKLTRTIIFTRSRYILLIGEGLKTSMFIFLASSLALFVVHGSFLKLSNTIHLTWLSSFTLIVWDATGLNLAIKYEMWNF